MKLNFVAVFTLIVTRFFNRGAGVVSFIILARGLGPEQFGSYAVITASIFIAVQLGNVGLRQAAGIIISREGVSEEKVILSLLFAWLPLTAIVSVSLFYFFDMGPTKLSSGDVIALLAATSGYLLLTLLQGIYLGRGNISALGFSDGAPIILLSILALGLFLFDNLSLHKALIIYALSFCVCSAGVLALQSSKLQALPKLDLRLTTLLLRKGVVFAISMFIIAMSPRVGMFIVQDYATPGGIGKLVAGQRLMEIILDVATAFGLAIFAKAAGEKIAREALAQSAVVAAWMFWLFAVVAIGVGIAAPQLLVTMLGAAFADSATITTILAFGLPAAAVIKIMNGAMTGLGKPILSAAIVGAGVGVNAGVTWWLAPEYKEYASAIGLVTGQVVSMICYIAVAKLRYSVNIASFFWPTFAYQNHRNTHGNS